MFSSLAIKQNQLLSEVDMTEEIYKLPPGTIFKFQIVLNLSLSG